MFKSHVLSIGASQWGKTTLHNQVHRAWPDVALFVNTNEQPVWGLKTRSLANLPQLITRAGGKIAWIPPEDPEAREAQLKQAVDKLARFGKDTIDKRGGGNWEQPWCKITIDDCTVYGDKPGDPMHFVSTRGLGAYGLSLTAICNNPTPLATEFRSNLTTRTIHNPGDEGLAFLRSKGYPADEIQRWTTQRDATGKPLFNWCLSAKEQWFRVRGRRAAAA